MMTSEWNRERLQEAAAKSFRTEKLIVVSCRAPYVHEYRDGKVACISPAGGLTAALKPTMMAVGGVWIAQASGSADRQTSSVRGRLRVPPERPAFDLRRLWISPELRQGHYEGFSNQALWPLCHNVYRRPVFRQSDWNAYRQVNEIFAEAVLEEAQGQAATVFIQDYHFATLPRLLRGANPLLTIGQFWHIPFPNVEIAQTLPWLDEVVDGMLGSDLLGFHLPKHCRNFLDAVESTQGAPIDRHKQTIWRKNHSTIVRDVPISIDFEQHTEQAASSDVDEAMRSWRRRIGNVSHVGLGIDRMDYTKGIPERLRAVTALFHRHPELRGTFTFVQIGVPSRGSIADYAELEHEIDSLASDINRTWGTENWTPVILEKRNLPPVEMMALHRLARFCMVTPLHDGMNLVAKEFVASRFDGDGVLILSRFAGAAEELRTALLVNPYAESDLCNAINVALRMTPAERKTRMTAARRAVSANNVYRWAGEFLHELGAERRAQRRLSPAIRAGALSASVA